jgi:hypothetical protein
MVAVEADNKAPTFEHMFTEAGEYPYFCLLHPNIGKEKRREIFYLVILSSIAALVLLL